MDRFIVAGFMIFFCKIQNLKSNMDRFIAYRVYADGKWYNDLKSNMDRFIDSTCSNCTTTCDYLKSNMDRFIATDPLDQRATQGI